MTRFLKALESGIFGVSAVEKSGTQKWDLPLYFCRSHHISGQCRGLKIYGRKNMQELMPKCPLWFV
uniref:Uncharacterized protein n=1 Tax=Rhizophora mucronata TaxID=61149 RepID=A0A2P2J359_RHIMU